MTLFINKNVHLRKCLAMLMNENIHLHAEDENTSAVLWWARVFKQQSVGQLQPVVHYKWPVTTNSINT